MTSEAMAGFVQMLFAGRQAVAGLPVPPVEVRRAGMEEAMAALPPLPGVTTRPVDAGGVPAEEVELESGGAAGTVLYLHGGGYYQGSVTTHRRLLTAICTAATTDGLNVGYRLAPEAPFPAAVDDALAAYRWLLASGRDPRRVVVAGDSAGGGLALALLLAIREAGDPLPAGAYLLSPWTDLAMTGASLEGRRAVDPMIDPDEMGTVVAWYVPDGDVRNPLVSPLFADLAGLPPLLVQVGAAEVLYDDSARLVASARAAGVEAELQEWEGAFHVFQAIVGLAPEADDAVARAGTWIAGRLR
ncbi:MAG TPA: alpha/beta hydrolase [Acidimicrobiales bacterium]|nr:alpha/beta hydrolase [Acidimicrobiales bacterium]